MVISPTASCSSDLMWTCLVWAERSTPDNFWVPSHRFNSATDEQKGISQTLYTDSEQTSRMPNSLMPSPKLRSANLPFWCDAVGDRTLASHTPSGRSNHSATRGLFNLAGWQKQRVKGYRRSSTIYFCVDQHLYSFRRTCELSGFIRK